MQTANATEDIARLIIAVQQARTGAVSAIVRISGRMQEIYSCATAASGAVEEQKPRIEWSEDRRLGSGRGFRSCRGNAAFGAKRPDSITSGGSAAAALRKEVEGFLSRVAA